MKHVLKMFFERIYSIIEGQLDGAQIGFRNGLGTREVQIIICFCKVNHTKLDVHKIIELRSQENNSQSLR